MSTDQPICMDCKHFNKMIFSKNSCNAFPEGIPEEIFYEIGTHSKPTTDQDNDIVFEPIEKKK